MIATARCLAALMWVFLLAACSSGPQLVKESQMADRQAVASIARANVTEQHNLKPKALRVALIGVNGNRIATDSDGGASRWDPTGISRALNTRNAINDATRSIPCAALDAVFDSLLPALDFAGLKAVPVTDMLSTPTYSAMAENQGGSLFCVAGKARASVMSLIRAGFSSQERMTEFERLLGKLIDEAGLDGVLLTLLTSQEMLAGESSLVLITRKPDGKFMTAWQGTLKPKRIRFEPVVADERSDEDRVKNITRVYHHSFTLLAVKLAEESTR